jgi:hypothetical protein
MFIDFKGIRALREWSGQMLGRIQGNGREWLF